jgi:hypothetical protein
MLINEFEDFKNKLKEFNFKYNSEILFEVIKDYDEETINKAYKNIIMNSPRLTSLNITYELQEDLRDIPKLNNNNIFAISHDCKYCHGKGFISMITNSGENFGYNSCFLCNCWNGNTKKEYYINGHQKGAKNVYQI